jgi:hypothetical protein
MAADAWPFVGDIFDGHDKPLAQNGKRGLDLLQLRGMGHFEQSINLWKVPIEMTREFRFVHLRGRHGLIQANLGLDQCRHRDTMTRDQSRR